MGIDVFRNALIDIKKRGIRSRYITTITKDNLSYCKEAMKIGREHIKYELSGFQFEFQKVSNKDVCLKR
jgi:hypothetical protein